MNNAAVARTSIATAVICIVAALANSAHAASPRDATVVTVKKLCPTCGKKIVQKLEQLPQVSAAAIDVDQRIVQVSPKPGHVVSPRLIWEIVEKGGEQPIRLEGPAGIFTAKPTK